MPSTPSPLSPHPRLFVRWFVQYNPMFTASALCVLGGVLLASRALGPAANVGLTVVLELYQWLVIGVAALLYRKMMEHRAATILGLIQLTFMLDPTLQLSAMATTQDIGATACWVLLFALKWRALAGAFQLKLSPTARTVPPLLAALVAALPNARLLGVGDDVLPRLLAAVVLGIGLVVIALPPQVTSRRALGDVGTLMFPRVLRGAAYLGAGGVLYQAWNATFAIGPGALVPAVLALGLVVAGRKHPRRIVAVAAAVVVLPRVMEHGALLKRLVMQLAPHGDRQWSITLLVAGFVLLPVGVVLHRRLSKRLALDEEEAARLAEQAPASPAAISHALA